MIDCGFVAANGRAALLVRSIVALLLRMAELLCLHDRSWLLCRRWPSCFAYAIDRGFVAVDGPVALLARSIVGLLLRMAEVWLYNIHNCCIDVALAGARTYCPHDTAFDQTIELFARKLTVDRTLFLAL